MRFIGRMRDNLRNARRRWRRAFGMGDGQCWVRFSFERPTLEKMLKTSAKP